MMQKWGCSKIETFLGRLVHAKQCLVFQKWKQFAQFERRAEIILTQKHLGIKRMEVVALKWLKRRLASAWKVWMQFVLEEFAREHAALEARAAGRLHRTIRGYMARQIRRKRQVVAKQIRAAVTIQTCSRQHFKHRILLRQQSQQKAALLRQLRCRIYTARFMQNIRNRCIRKHTNATRIEALYRGYNARRQYMHIWNAKRRNVAANKIQMRFRRYMLVARKERLKVKQRQERIEMLIDNWYRMCRAKIIAKRLKRRLASQAQIRRNTALRIQRVYRGHR